MSINRSQAIRSAEHSTGFASVWTDREGRRSIAHERGRAHLPPIAIKSQADHLHLDGSHGEAALATARHFRARGGSISLDAGSPKPKTKDLLQLADVVICSTQFRTAFAGQASPEDALPAFEPFNIPILVFTLGDQGAILYEDGKAIHQPAFTVRAIDTTGAGDVFSGAFIRHLGNGNTPETALRFACAAAAIKCGRRGNKEALPSVAEVEKKLRG